MEAAYSVFLSIHSWLRWVVLILAVLTLARSARGVSSRSLYTDADRKAGLFFMISCDVQLLVGLVLYLGLSPVYGLAAFQTPGINAMKNADIRYFAVEHIAIMIVALALVHIGYSKAKKATSDLVKHKSSLIFFGIALLLMLSRIPFSTRPLFRF